MSGISSFVMSLICASAAAGLVETLLPERSEGLRRGLGYLISLALLLTLLTPIRSFVAALGGLDGTEISSEKLDEIELEALARVNSLTALRIGEEVAAKFALEPELITAELEGEQLKLELPRGLGVLAVDVEAYVESRWGYACEVNFVQIGGDAN